MLNEHHHSRIVIAVNERGRRIGERHHNATISDETVQALRDRHEEDGAGYKQLCREFGMTLTTVRKICCYQRRAQTPARWKTVRVAHG
jgi:hypothetical protein